MMHALILLSVGFGMGLLTYVFYRFIWKNAK